jgi:hypothetical protein
MGIRIRLIMLARDRPNLSLDPFADGLKNGFLVVHGPGVLGMCAHPFPPLAANLVLDAAAFLGDQHSTLEDANDNALLIERVIRRRRIPAFRRNFDSSLVSLT